MAVSPVSVAISTVRVDTLLDFPAASETFFALGQLLSK